MQLFGTSFNMDLGAFRLRVSIGLDERDHAAGVRLEDMPRLDLARDERV